MVIRLLTSAWVRRLLAAGLLFTSFAAGSIAASLPLLSTSFGNLSVQMQPVDGLTDATGGPLTAMGLSPLMRAESEDWFIALPRDELARMLSAGILHRGRSLDGERLVSAYVQDDVNQTGTRSREMIPLYDNRQRTWCYYPDAQWLVRQEWWK